MWGVSFNMLRPANTSVQCQVTRGALDELATGEGRTLEHQQLIIFEQWRAPIERIASQKYDVGKLERGMVIVTPEDVAALLAHPAWPAGVDRHRRPGPFTAVSSSWWITTASGKNMRS